MKKARPDILCHVLSACFLFFVYAGSAQVPAAGRSGTLEICNWNIEWFGNTRAGYGPADDRLQQKNIRDVLHRAEMDIWVFCEVSGVAAFDSMMATLPDYAYTVATYKPEQKTAVVYRKDLFRMVSAKLAGTAHKDSFSTGRFPLEVALVPLQASVIDTLFILALHLKSNIGTDTEKMAAYHSRKRSSEWLRMYLDRQHKQHYCMVLGDWNDDLDISIYNALPSPFTELLKPGFPFTFITRPFSERQQGSTTGYDNPIDHQLVSSKLAHIHPKDSVFIWRIDPYITDYSTTTSDHYPVYSRFSTHITGILTPGRKLMPHLVPLPADKSVRIDLSGSLTITSVSGQPVLEIRDYAGAAVDVSGLAAGLYVLNIRSSTLHHHFQLIIQH